MPRPRKDRLLPAIATYTEELVRTIAAQVRRDVVAGTDALAEQLRALQRDVDRIKRAVGTRGAAPGGGRGRPPSGKVCSVPGCGNPHVARGLCRNHYQQLRYEERRQAQGKSVRHRKRGPLAAAPGRGQRATKLNVVPGGRSRREPEAHLPTEPHEPPEDRPPTPAA